MHTKLDVDCIKAYSIDNGSKVCIWEWTLRCSGDVVPEKTQCCRISVATIPQLKYSRFAGTASMGADLGHEGSVAGASSAFDVQVETKQKLVVG